MELALICLLGVALLELAVYSPLLWPFHRYFALPVLLCVALSSCAVLLVMPGLGSALVMFFGVYRTVNWLKVYSDRVQSKYLQTTARQASLWLVVAQIVSVIAAGLAGHINWPNSGWLLLLAGLQVLLAAGLLVTLRHNAHRSVFTEAPSGQAVLDLPTLSVLIPARNETVELEDCLQSLVASTYPKLEVIVLDDSSQDKRTPEIIRSFAQHGVRFIPGEMPPDNWLAKNFAYNELVGTSNGEVVLLCGVDTQFAPGSLTKIVSELLSKNHDMLCLMPRNVLLSSDPLRYLLIQPLRYAWELALPRRLSRPPVLSTCWLIRRDALLSAGGFASVSHKIIPESYFAKIASMAGKYGFLAADGDIEVTSRKSLSEQLSTATRTRYPQLHKRLELVALMSLAEMWLFASPVALLVAGILGSQWLLIALSLIGLAYTGMFNFSVVSITYRQSVVKSFWLGVLAGLYDVYLLNFSMLSYEFGEVLWKGRNVCIPVMRAATPEPATTLNSAQK